MDAGIFESFYFGFFYTIKLTRGRRAGLLEGGPKAVHHNLMSLRCAAASEGSSMLPSNSSVASDSLPPA